MKAIQINFSESWLKFRLLNFFVFPFVTVWFKQQVSKMDGDSGTYLSRVGSLSRIMEIMDTSLGTKRTDDSLKHEV